MCSSDLLSAKARDEELKVLKDLSFDQPKTKEMAKVLEALEVESSALIVTDKPEENVVKSARNISGITTTPAGLLNVVDILSHRMLLMTVAAVRNAEELWGAKEGSNESV